MRKITPTNFATNDPLPITDPDHYFHRVKENVRQGIIEAEKRLEALKTAYEALNEVEKDYGSQLGNPGSNGASAVTETHSSIALHR